MNRPLSRRNLILISSIGFVIGVLLGSGLVFSILFIMKVLPHGGL